MTGDEAAEAIAWGQADFDQPYGELSADDRALLYAFWNQKRHVEELSEAFRQIFIEGWPNQPLIVIDLGCGPFTGGLALAGQLPPTASFNYIGIDRSHAMCRLGERLADEADAMDDLPKIDHQWSSSITDIEWQTPPGWRPVLVVVSFLLASRSLDAEKMVGDVNECLWTISHGETTLVYTNSPKPGPNSSFPSFQAALQQAGFQKKADDLGEVLTERRKLKLRYALFHRPEQRTLRLGEN